jgi:hypothetical protein
MTTYPAPHKPQAADYRWDVPEQMRFFYDELRMMGFVNTTPPTPDEWEHQPGVLQVRISHVARETTIRYRGTPPAPAERIPSIEGQRNYDKSFPWSSTTWTHNCSPETFRAFLARVSRTIGTELTMRQSQSRT